jgi:cysteine desulfurase/selenocysteine lyase
MTTVPRSTASEGSPWGFAVPHSAGLDVEALRAAEFPAARERVYLDAASIGPLPRRTVQVLDAFNQRRSRPWELGPADLFDLFTLSRARIARLVNADSSEIALAPNTSFGLGLAARALPLAPGDVIVASEREFPSNIYPWMRLEDRGVRLELVPVTAEGWPDEARLLERIEDPRVRILAVSLTQFSNGYTVDLDALSRATRRTGTMLVVDAIQAVGQLPVDLARTPVDLLSCGGQKWLLSPWGSGFVYVRRELIERLDPAITGWMAFEGTDDFSRLTTYNPSLRPDARRFELITLPFQDFAGMNASLELLHEVGIGRIAEHLRGLHAPVLGWARRRGVRVTSPVDHRGSGILCVAPDDPAAVHHALRQAGVSCSLREGSLRLSPHCYTNLQDMERVAEVLEASLQ